MGNTVNIGLFYLIIAQPLKVIINHCLVYQRKKSLSI